MPSWSRKMKNIQIIDGADNAGYWVYQINDAQFKIIFPKKNQNIEFSGDLFKRLGDKAISKFLTDLWGAKMEKSSVIGIHGTLFYELEWKKKYYPTKNEDDLLRF